MAETRTDHSVDIARLRLLAQHHKNPIYTNLGGGPTMNDQMHQQMALINECAAALLEVHDDTGISLDDWKGPRELVEFALGHPIQENHV